MKDASREIRIMGILNLTPDSFYGPSRHRLAVLDEAPDIVDLGAVSTRPGASEVSLEEEWSRLEPVLRLISTEYRSLTVSVDTTRPTIVERACDVLGRPIIVNDISAGEDDPQMLSTVASLGLEYVAMHKRGTPATMQSLCSYDDVVEEVLSYFDGFAERAAQAGVSHWILDPGFGFAKTAQQCFELFAALPRFSGTERPVLVGISRKSFIYRTLGITPEESLPATSALHLAALERGADILRVHDVAEARRIVDLYRKLEA